MKYALIGAGSYLFALCLMFLLIQVLLLPPAFSYAVTQIIILLVSFVSARRWVFNPGRSGLVSQGVKYILAYLVFRFADWCVFVLLNSLLGVHYYFAILLAMGSIFPIKYLAYKILVFQDTERIDTEIF